MLWEAELTELDCQIVDFSSQPVKKVEEFFLSGIAGRRGERVKEVHFGIEEPLDGDEDRRSIGDDELQERRDAAFDDIIPLLPNVTTVHLSEANAIFYRLPSPDLTGLTFEETLELPGANMHFG